MSFGIHSVNIAHLYLPFLDSTVAEQFWQSSYFIYTLIWSYLWYCYPWEISASIYLNHANKANKFFTTICFIVRIHHVAPKGQMHIWFAISLFNSIPKSVRTHFRYYCCWLTTRTPITSQLVISYGNRAQVSFFSTWILQSYV